MKKLLTLLLAMGIFVPGPCLTFDGYQGHEGQIPFCQNNKTGRLRVAPMKDIDRTTGLDYEPYCNTRFFYGTTIPIETLIWVTIQGSQKSSSVRVFDSQNQFLGILLGYDDDTNNLIIVGGVPMSGTGAVIYVPSLDRSVKISVETGDMIDTLDPINENLFYDDENCTTISTYGPPTLSYRIIKYGNDYYAGDRIAPSSVSINSYGLGGACSSGPILLPSVPIQKITQLPFTLPVALPLRFE